MGQERKEANEASSGALFDLKKEFKSTNALFADTGISPATEPYSPDETAARTGVASPAGILGRWLACQLMQPLLQVLSTPIMNSTRHSLRYA